ncbi:MAG TPA: cysteine desulfurase family protein [Flavobacterium sp.]|nr:cysteine desulfurase family protein [Flavobacterium sp.]
MKKVYLDNAATTAMRPEVISEMATVMQEDFGNPSSTHSFGRSAKNILELSRKNIAKRIKAAAAEIIFTSGGTETNNWILRSAVKDLNIKRIISSKLEHHAVLHTIEMLEKEFDITVAYVKIKSDGSIDVTHLVELLSHNAPTLVSLMHVNNEIGTVLDLESIGRICKQHNAFFHTDAIQSVGKENLDMQQLQVDFLSASAHKFHGPKGVGFAFVRKGLGLQPMLFGGEQEKGLRAGTEAVHNIAGMAKALELSYDNLDSEKAHILSLKNYLIEQCGIHFPGFTINGNANGFYNIANILFPFGEEKTAMILFHLDMKGIAVSRGSACQSGSIRPSHVLAEILDDTAIRKPSLRISFSHYNSKADVDYLIEVLKTL